MDDERRNRARELVKELEDAGLNSGLLMVQGTVMLRSPGAPYNESPLLFYDESDLNNAIELSLLEKQRVTGSLTWEWYVTKTKYSA